VFIRLLQALEGPQVTEYEAIAITDSIGDWIDSDDEPRLNGAEASATRPWRRPTGRPTDP
jgi:general secretion pathway protein K